MEEPQRQALLEGLRQVGLNRYEASVYIGLVTDQTAKVAEISRRTGVPQPKVYQALDALADKGFCTIGTDAVNRYRPTAPRVAFEGTIARLRTEADQARRLAEDLEGLLEQGQGQELWAPPIEVVKGLRQIRGFLVERIHGALEEVLYMGKTPQVPTLDVARALHEKGEEGVAIRFVLEPDYLAQVGEADAGEIALYRETRGEKRVLESLPTKLVVVDRRIAMLSISRSGGDSFLALALRHRGFVEHVLASFERHWEAARPFAE